MKRPLPAVLPLALAALLLAALAASLVRTTDSDVWWHLRAGEWILSHRAVPDRNLFSSTAPDAPWVAHEWLSEVLFALACRVAPGALVALKMLLAAAIALFLFLAGRAASGSAPAGAAAAGLAMLPLQTWLEFRPQLFSYALFALTLYLLQPDLRLPISDCRLGDPAKPEIENRKSKIENAKVWLLAPLVALWANLHGGYLAAFGLAALVMLSEPHAARPLALPVALAAVASLLNPFTIWLPLFVVQLSRSPTIVEGIVEWWSPDFHRASGHAFEAALLLAALALALGRPRTRDVVCVLVFAHLGLQHWRHVPLFVLAATPLMARFWCRVAAEAATRVRLPRVLAPALAAATLAASAMWLALRVPSGPWLPTLAREHAFPMQAVALLKRTGVPRAGRLLNEYSWGGYLIWRGCPRQGVFIDGRADAYPPRVMADYHTLLGASGPWRRLLEEYDVRAILAQPSAPLCLALKDDPRWGVAQCDGVSVLLIRMH